MPRKLTTKEFVKKANKIHNGFYDYSETKYIGSREKLIIICPIHGKFTTISNSHLSGKNCVGCGILVRSKKQQTTTQEFIAKAIKKHGHRYDYTKVIYKRIKSKITIICSIHGEFEQIPNNHLNGAGCFQCRNTKKKTFTTDRFGKKANKIHNGFYDYSETKYKKCDKKIIIICSKHGKFKQTPSKHLSGHGCQQCANNYSILENKWLDSLNIKNLERQKRIHIKENYYKPDGYDPDTNTVYEFWGDYWHGNPKKYDPADININTKQTFGELYEQTMNKIQKYKTNGYQIIDVWESDFLRDQT